MKRSILIISIILLVVVFSWSCSSICAEKKVWGKDAKAAQKLVGELQSAYQQVIQLIDKALNEELGDPDELARFKEEFTKKFNPEIMPEKLTDLQDFGFRMSSEINKTCSYWKEKEYVDETILENLKAIMGLTVILPPSYNIGDTGPSGVGKVCYITDSGLHGLEAAPSDQSTGIAWITGGNTNHMGQRNWNSNRDWSGKHYQNYRSEWSQRKCGAIM